MHHDAADGDRLERRDRGQGALPPDRDQDVAQHRLRLLGREFVRERPARRAADHAEPLLQGEVVDLVDDAVDVVGQRRAIGGDVVVIGQHLVDAAAQPRAIVDGQPPFAELRQSFRVSAREGGARLAPGIGEEFERPACGDRRIELAQGAGGGVSRIGESGLAGGGPLFVQGKKAGALHIDFAADLDHLGPPVPGQRRWHAGQGTDVRGDILPGDAVAARGGLHQAAIFVAKPERKSIDLGFGHDLDRILGDESTVGRTAEEIADAGEEIAHIGFLERVFERQHRPGMGDLGKAGGRRRPDPVLRAVAADQCWKAGLDRGVALPQCVVIGIGNFRGGVGIIEPVVPPDLLGQRRQLGPRLGLCQVLGRARIGLGLAPSRGAHARPPAIRLAAAARASAVTMRPDSMRAISSCRVSGSSSSTRVTVWRSESRLATRQ